MNSSPSSPRRSGRSHSPSSAPAALRETRQQILPVRSVEPTWSTGNESPFDMSEHLLTSRELADLLGFSPAWVQDQFEAGRLPGFRVGGRLRFRLSEVDAWLEEHRQGPAPCDRSVGVL